MILKYFTSEKKLDLEVIQNQYFKYFKIRKSFILKYFTIEKNVDFEVIYFTNEENVDFKVLQNQGLQSMFSPAQAHHS